jgi:hypothetical protein
MGQVRRIRRAVAVGGCAALITASCGSAHVSPGLGIDWGRSALVERPAEAFDFGPGGTMAPPAGPGTAGHPGHFPGQAIMADVIAMRSGGLVSVGYVYPGWFPVAWTSPDAIDWHLHRLGTTDFTFPVALAVGADGTIVAVGRSGSSPVAWTSADGADWREHPVTISGDGLVAERMTTVLATPDGFIAGGSIGPESFGRHARFWRSSDGVIWQPVPDEPSAFADAEVRSIVRLGAGYVAIGATGTVQQVTGSVAWTSPDGVRWSREAAPDLQKGRAVSLVEAPFGGLVAVGADLDEREALVWTSADGRSWRLVPGESSRRYDGKIRMTDVTAVADELIAVGNYINLQYGTARAWVSRDAIHWQPSTEVPVMEQGEPYAVVVAGPGAVSVGSFGAPDDYIPTVWLSPAR